MDIVRYLIDEVEVTVERYLRDTRTRFRNVGRINDLINGRTTNTRRDGTPQRTRGTAGGFSDRSRRSLRLIGYNTNWLSYCTFTYGDTHRPKDGETFRKQGKRLARLLAEQGHYAVIRKEVERTAYGFNPHFHVLSTGALTHAGNQALWARCVGVRLEDLPSFATRTREVYELDGVVAYFCKDSKVVDGRKVECAVFDDAFGSVGKWWIEVNGDLRPKPEVITGSLVEMAPVLRIINKLKRGKVREAHKRKKDKGLVEGSPRKVTRGGGLRGETYQRDYGRSKDHAGRMDPQEGRTHDRKEERKLGKDDEHRREG